MEAFLLTLDVLAIILLCWGVKRVSISNDPEDIGLFAYVECRVSRRRPTQQGSRSDNA